jgi:hypothetical protein
MLMFRKKQASIAGADRSQRCAHRRGWCETGTSRRLAPDSRD